MYVVCVTIAVIPEHVAAFIDATLLNAEHTRQEPENVRFDVLQSEENPALCFLYEAYQTKDDFVAHQQTPHYLSWRETVQPWMAQPRQGVRYQSLFFTE